MSFTPFSDGWHTARKEHRCEWCAEKIVPGERYYFYSGVCDGDSQYTKLHAECHEAMERDTEDARRYDPHLHDYYLPDDCFRGMTRQETEDRHEARRAAAG